MIERKELLNFFEKFDEEDKKKLFTPGNTFALTDGDRMIQYVALDPRQRPPKNGLFMPWIRVEDDADTSDIEPPTLDLEEMVSEAELCISTAELVLSDEEYKEFTERVTELL